MKNKWKLVLALTLFACAIGIGVYAYKDGGESAPDDASLAVPWYCHRCNKGYMLTPAQYEPTIGKGVHPANEGDSGDMTAMVMIVECPVCKGAAVAARRCEVHGEIYDPRDADPARRQCSQCAAKQGATKQ
ncbi:MAG: hypothetical protein H6819_04365 [Phycisphaerales bacterium]|nr:hypothetical protein [Phycisphaerales bacterium]MCB9856433.1 hypothetical protein [Phycisphaerales bacterium]MCB9864564.1 hypothetical protein [Phycisphaerales bacterium]